MPDDSRAGQPGRAAAHRRFVIFPRRRIEASHSYLGVPRATRDAPEAPRRACTGTNACHHVDEHIVRFKLCPGSCRAPGLLPETLERLAGAPSVGVCQQA